MITRFMVITFLALTIVSTPWVAGDSAEAQECPGSFDPFGYLVPRLPSLFNALEQDQPGVTNPCYPFVHLPKMRGEFRFRPILTTLQSSSIQDSTGKYDLKGDLLLPGRTAMVQFMIRAQLARYSLRGYYEPTMRNIHSSRATFYWPQWRVGLDVDLIENEAWRAGVDFDVNWDAPGFTYSVPSVVSNAVKWERPVTFGFHAIYNPVSCGAISSSFEARYRMPLIPTNKVYEFEVAGGLRFPRTIFGNTAIRAGVRVSDIIFENSGTELKTKWLGVFGEWTAFF
jgi:hypothetical protein